MESVVILVLVGLILLQLPLALYVYVDAKHRKIENPEVYSLGIWVAPLAGILVFAVYMSRRDELPRRDPTAFEQGRADFTNETRTYQWAVRVPGLRGLPRRLVYTVTGLGRYLWGGLIGIPLVLLIGTLVVDGRIEHFYVGVSALGWIVLLVFAMWFTETTAEVDTDRKMLRVVYTFGNHPLSRSPYESEIPLDDVVAAEIVPVDERHVLRFEYEHDLATSRPKAFLIGDRDVIGVLEALRQSGVTIRTARDERFGNWQVWAKAGLTALVIGVVPVSLVIVQPNAAASTPALLLGLAICIWVIVGSIRYALSRLPIG
ncbi:hypothetical protein ACNS7O_16565 (plasmid) [Haloferacaceae archaeon DSL9]